MHISHVPNFSSTGGAYSNIHQEMLEKADFFAGNFSPQYGNRLSSVTDISFREGNKNEMDFQLDVNMAMAGFVIEGPLNQGKGSWILTGRQSYLEVLADNNLINFDAVPVSRDSQFKLVYDLSQIHKITVLNTFAQGYFEEENLNYFNWEENYLQNTFGIALNSYWNDKFISNTSSTIPF